jgi:hypothetical protein
MSLTSILTDIGNQKLRDKFKTEFIHPRFKFSTELKAEPKTLNYGIVGTAFDYLIRFYLERINKDNIESSRWVADSAIGILNTKIINHPSDTILTGINKDKEFGKEELLQKIQIGMLIAKEEYKEYIKTGELRKQLVESTIFLAKLDMVRRNGAVAWAFDEVFDNPNPDDVKDITSMFFLLSNQPFTAKEKCYLNPTFGTGSLLVGGADADLIIDNILIDIKVTKLLKLNREYLNQTLGYYILSLIGGVNGSPLCKPIEYIGIYFARHGVLWKEPISSFGDSKKFDAFKEWFISFVKERNPSIEATPKQSIVLNNKEKKNDKSVKRINKGIKYFIDTETETIESGDSKDIVLEDALRKIKKIRKQNVQRNFQLSQGAKIRNNWIR